MQKTGRSYHVVVVAAAMVIAVAGAATSLVYLHRSAQAFSGLQAMFESQAVARELNRTIEAVALRAVIAGQELLATKSRNPTEPRLWRELILEPAVDSITVRIADGEDLSVFARGSKSWKEGVPQQVVDRHRLSGAKLVVQDVSSGDSNYILVSRMVELHSPQDPMIVTVTLSDSVLRLDDRELYPSQAMAMALARRDGDVLLTRDANHIVSESRWREIRTREWSSSNDSALYADVVVARAQLPGYPYALHTVRSLDPYMRPYRIALAVWSGLIVVLAAVGGVGVRIAHNLELRRRIVEQESIRATERSRTQLLLRQVQDAVGASSDPVSGGQAVADLLSDFLGIPVSCVEGNSGRSDNVSPPSKVSESRPATVWEIPYRTDATHGGRIVLSTSEVAPSDLVEIVDTAVAIAERGLERKAFELELKRSEARFRAFMDHTPTPVVISDTAEGFFFTNPAYASLAGSGTSDHDKNRSANAELMLAVAPTGDVLGDRDSRKTELTVATSNGERHLNVSRFSFSGPAGQRMDAAIGVEITELVRAERRLQTALAERQVLLREIHHRVKNNLAVVDALLMMEQGRMETEFDRSALIHVRNSVQSIALIHRSLYGEGSQELVDFPDYCRSLVTHVATSLGITDPEATIALRLDRVVYPMAAVKSVGLILNELLTNAVKHGRSPDGSLSVEISLTDDAGLHTLTVRDNGRGYPHGSGSPPRNGMGLTLIEALASELDASIDISNDGGTVVRLRFPAPQAGTDGK